MIDYDLLTNVSAWAYDISAEPHCQVFEVKVKSGLSIDGGGHIHYNCLKPDGREIILSDADLYYSRDGAIKGLCHELEDWVTNLESDVEAARAELAEQTKNLTATSNELDYWRAQI